MRVCHTYMCASSQPIGFGHIITLTNTSTEGGQLDIHSEPHDKTCRTRPRHSMEKKRKYPEAARGQTHHRISSGFSADQQDSQQKVTTAVC